MGYYAAGSGKVLPLLVDNYHRSLRNNTEERSFYLLQGGSPKSRTYLSTCAFVFYILQIQFYIEWGKFIQILHRVGQIYKKFFIQVILTP